MGAESLLRAYDSLIKRLHDDAQSCGEAPENADCEFFVQQALFKTQHNRICCALFFIEGEEVYIFRVRAPGQTPVSPEDLV